MRNKYTAFYRNISDRYRKLSEAARQNANRLPFGSPYRPGTPE